MHNYGDITKIDGSLVEPVDIVTGGSPCQNFSMSGNREGLRGEKSSLFYEMVRVVSEMRKAKDKPRFVVFENVVGLLYCNDGLDFHTVLSSFSNIACPGFIVPSKPYYGWTKAGYIKGKSWSIAWRVCNSASWGLKQRRRRIMLLVDFESVSADKILFGKRESHTSSTSGINTISVYDDLFAGQCWMDYCWEGMNSTEEPDIPISNDTISVIENDVSPKYNVKMKPALAVLNRGHMYGCFEECSIFEKVLNATAHKMEFFHVRGKEIFSFRDNSSLFLLQPSSREKVRLEKECLTIRSISPRCYGDPTFAPVVITFDCHGNNGMFDKKNAETLYKISCDNTQKDNNITCHADGSIRIRIITPNECERMFGYPDGWTSAHINNKGDIVETSRLARMRILGNSIAIPQWQWLLARIKNTSGATKLASLFDGIGGFPHCAKLNGIIPVWCSEIDKIASGISELWFGNVEQKTKG